MEASPCHIHRMKNHSAPRVEIRQRVNGGWEFRLFTDEKDPLKFEGDHRAYGAPQEAERAGHEAQEAFVKRMSRP
jgi:hypothetical protein